MAGLALPDDLLYCPASFRGRPIKEAASGESLATNVSSRARPTNSTRADVQGLRALAVLLVIAFHAGLPVPGGFAGVDVFFVISGFVIIGLILREIDGHQFSFRRSIPVGSSGCFQRSCSC